MDRPNYTPEQRSRNRLSIILTTLAVLGVLVVSGSLQGWSAGSLIGVMVIVVAFAAMAWPLFASQSARPLPPNRKHVRSEHLSDEEWKATRGY